MREKLLTAEEVASYLGISEEDVKNLVEKGELPAYKIGGAFLRFKREQIETYRKRRHSLNEARSVLFKDRGIKQILPEDGTPTLRQEEDGYLSKTGSTVKYTLWERLFDFIYFNDFYIFSAILLVIIVLFFLDF